MEHLVQLRESEYKDLFEKANLNESQINEKALMLYKDRGVAEIKIELKHKNSDWYNTFRFDCSAFVWYKDEKFFIPEGLRNRLGKLLEDTMIWEMRKTYGDSEKLLNALKRKSKSLSEWKRITEVMAVSGWVSFVLYLCFS